MPRRFDRDGDRRSLVLIRDTGCLNISVLIVVGVYFKIKFVSRLYLHPCFVSIHARAMIGGVYSGLLLSKERGETKANTNKIMLMSPPGMECIIYYSLPSSPFSSRKICRANSTPA